MQTLFVTGTDTGVGKTHIACLIIRQLRASAVRVGAYKPVCSGANRSADHPVWDDITALRDACGPDMPLKKSWSTISSCSFPEESRHVGNVPHVPPDTPDHPIDRICPQRFLAPVAPNLAARMEGRRVDNELLVTGARAWSGLVDQLVIEGAGGVLSPLSDTSSNLDLAVALQSSVVVVAANRLGVINHTRLTVAAITARGLSVEAIVLNDTAPPAASVTDHSLTSNAEQLQHWLPGIPLVRCEWQAMELAWKTSPPAFAGNVVPLGTDGWHRSDTSHQS